MPPEVIQLLKSMGFSDEEIAQAQARAQGAGAQGAGAKSDAKEDLLVYMGTKKVHGPVTTGREYVFQGRGGRGFLDYDIREEDDIRPFSSVMMDVYEWEKDPELKKANVARLEKGLGIEINNDKDLEDAWRALVIGSAMRLKTGQKLTPWEVMDLWGKDGVLGGKLAAPKTTTHTSVTYTDPDTARAWVSELLRQKLGRDARASEEREFIDMLRAEEQRNPNVTTTTQDAEGNTSSVTRGGVTQTGLSEKYAEGLRDNPEYAEYQGGTRYANAFWNAIASPL